MMQAKQIVFVDRGMARLQSVPLPAVGDHQVGVKTAYTVVSAGTERANLMGEGNTHAHIRDDSALPLFPRVLGYCGVGTVETVGGAVTSVQPGDRVILYFGTHSSEQVLEESKVVRIEDTQTDLMHFAPAVIAQIAMSAVRMARIEMGESALVMGLGILGLYAVQWCRLSGACPVIAADPDPRRREMALALGADEVLDPMAEDYARQVRALSGGGVDMVIEGSGAAVALEQALECTARFARVVLLGCTRRNDRCIDFYHQVHFPGVQILGAHTMARPPHDSRPGYWTYRDELSAVARLVSAGRIDLMANVQEVCLPGEAPSVYARLAADRDFPTGLVFDWRDCT